MPPASSIERQARDRARAAANSEIAPENDEAATWLVTLATATAGVHADEDQQRRHQESAADAEHARDESDREPHGEQQEDVDRHVGDRKIDLHDALPGKRLLR